MPQRNNNAKRAKTMGRVAMSEQARKNSRNSPWRRLPSCTSAKSRQVFEDAKAKDRKK